MFQANDEDTGLNGDVIYLITNTTHQGIDLTINSENGFISLKSPIDYEAVNTLQLEITARDKGTPSLSKKGIFLIKLKAYSCYFIVVIFS